MTFGAIALTGCLVTLILGIAATHPEELREHRWLKMILSMPPVMVIASALAELSPINAYFSAFSIALLAFIWRSPLAHFSSLGFMRLLNGDMNRPTGIRAELGAARSLRKHGELDDALRQTKLELDKEPYHYEGLLLLAQIYMDMDQPDRALKTLDLILARTPLTEEQRVTVTATRREVEESLL
ncbi:MAG: tetratricopeptide repeat protein, partial [Limisphaerales bacterium]